MLETVSPPISTTRHFSSLILGRICLSSLCWRSSKKLPLREYKIIVACGTSSPDRKLCISCIATSIYSSFLKGKGMYASPLPASSAPPALHLAFLLVLNTLSQSL